MAGEDGDEDNKHDEPDCCHNDCGDGQSLPAFGSGSFGSCTAFGHDVFSLLRVLAWGKYKRFSVTELWGETPDFFNQYLILVSPDLVCDLESDPIVAIALFLFFRIEPLWNLLTQSAYWKKGPKRRALVPVNHAVDFDLLFKAWESSVLTASARSTFKWDSLSGTFWWPKPAACIASNDASLSWRRGC